jgi:hypothetical protein
MFLQLPELPPANTSAIFSIKNEDNIFLAFIITQSKLISGNTNKIDLNEASGLSGGWIDHRFNLGLSKQFPDN